MAAYESAMRIYFTLKDAFDTLQIDKDHAQFNETCRTVIALERPELDKHRGWSEFLINLAIAIPTLGLGLIVKGIINKFHHNAFFFVHKTDSAGIVDEIQETLNKP